MDFSTDSARASTRSRAAWRRQRRSAAAGKVSAVRAAAVGKVAAAGQVAAAAQVRMSWPLRSLERLCGALAQMGLPAVARARRSRSWCSSPSSPSARPGAMVFGVGAEAPAPNSRAYYILKFFDGAAGQGGQDRLRRCARTPHTHPRARTATLPACRADPARVRRPPSAFHPRLALSAPPLPTPRRPALAQAAWRGRRGAFGANQAGRHGRRGAGGAARAAHGGAARSARCRRGGAGGAARSAQRGAAFGRRGVWAAWRGRLYGQADVLLYICDLACIGGLAYWKPRPQPARLRMVEQHLCLEHRRSWLLGQQLDQRDVTFVFRLVCLRSLECISYCVNKMRECPKIKCAIVPYIEYCLGGPRAGGGAPSGGYTTTETCQRVNPSNQWVSQHCAVSNDVWDAQGPEFEHVAWTHGRFIRRHEPRQGCSVRRFHRNRGVSTHCPVKKSALKALRDRA